MTQPADDLCQCVVCGRVHRKLNFSKSPFIASSLQERMTAYAERFDRLGKSQHGDVIRNWIREIRGEK